MPLYDEARAREDAPSKSTPSDRDMAEDAISTELRDWNRRHESKDGEVEV
jgi:hypothetical protein